MYIDNSTICKDKSKLKKLRKIIVFNRFQFVGE